MKSELTKSLKKDWLWSIQPLVGCAKWLGVDLLNAHQMGHCRLFTLHSIFCLLLSVANQVICLLYVFGNTKELSNKYISEDGFNSDAFTWNAAIDFSNYAIHSLGSQLVLLIIIRTRWIKLVKSFQRFEFVFHENFIIVLRKASILAILYGVIVHAVMCANTAWYHKDEESPLTITLVAWLAIISQFYPIVALVLFVVLGYALSTAFQLIRKDLKSLHKKHTDEFYFRRLLALKNIHALLCDATEQVDDCFGWIFLFSIPFHFVVIITTSFFTFGREVEPLTIMEITLLLVHVFHLSVVCYAADFIRDQADSVSRKLIQIQSDLTDPIFKSFANAFFTQADQFSPQISAIGFFRVSKKTIPQVVGTSLTYFFILYQFQSMEKDFKDE